MGPKSKVIRTESGKVCIDPACKCSGSLQPWQNFHKKSDNKDGHYNLCKVCRNLRKAEQELTKKTRVKPIKTKEGKSCTRKDCQHGNTIQPFSNFNKRLSGYRPECRDCQSKEKKVYQKANMDIIRAGNARWRAKNPEKYKESNRESSRKYAKRRRANSGMRLDHSMGTAMYHALLDQKEGRHWETLVPYSLDDLIEHLSKQFYIHPETLEPMTWDNYGSAWHVDHIIPRSSFDYLSELDQDFQDCWSLANLQPLWQEANLAKSAKSVEEWAEISAEFMWTKNLFGNYLPVIKEVSHEDFSILS